MPPPPPVRVAFLGFSEFERNSLASYFRLATQRTPRYAHTPMLTEAECLVADADHAPSVQLVLATERQAHTVFIGARPPDGCRAWLQRPIDALQVMRHLDLLGAGPAAASLPAAATDASRADGAAADVPAADAPGADVPADAPPPAGDADAPASASASAPAPASAPAAPRTIEIAMAARAAAGEPVLLAGPALRPVGVEPSLPPRRGSPPPPRALLVDDSEVALRYLQQRLQPWGVQADTAGDSTAALELLGRHSYQIVFVDVELGQDSELDGLELCRRIKQSEAAVEAAVVLVSAHRSELDRVRGALAGCDAYLGKPLDEAELRRLLLRQGCRAPAAAVPG